MDNNPSYFKGPDRPVEQVGWDDAQEFLNRLNARGDGYRYRLPTEAEWEYAARAGSTDLFVDSRLSGVAWYGAGGANLLQSKGETHDVGRKQPNAWGLYDVHGNVNEWVQDWFSADYYRNSPRDDPAGPATGRTRVTRGGSWYSNASYLRLSNRYEMFAGLSRRDVGFRCVREAIR
jgi:formylglycine-generating enzyme required for sulfatase activity